MALISEEYRALNTQLHEENEVYGVGGHRWGGHLVACLKATNSGSVLDYGCGKQTLNDAFPDLDVTGYDPCIEGLDAPPIAHDFVICTDVLEHIEEDCIDTVLAHIRHLAIKGVLLVVNFIPARKFLSDGRNAHILQRPVR